MEARERINFWRPSELERTTVLEADHTSRSWHVYHETYTICTVLPAAPGVGADWVYRRQRRWSGPGAVMLIEPGEIHYNTKVVGPGSFRVLQTEPARMHELAADLGLRSSPHFRVAQDEDSRLFRAFADLHASLEGPATAMERQTRFLSAFWLLLSRNAESRPRPIPDRPERAAVRKAREIIHARYAEGVTLDELASECGLSPFVLVRSFRRSVGVPPHAYLTALRVAHARKLLEAGLRPAEAASAAGFYDQSHMTAHFRRALGITPAPYRRMLSNGMSISS